MRDFVIPTLEQFQHLRELRKAKRRTATAPHNPLRESPSKSGPQHKHLSGNSLLWGSSQSTWRLVMDRRWDHKDGSFDEDEDDDSSTECGTPPCKRTRQADNEQDEATWTGPLTPLDPSPERSSPNALDRPTITHESLVSPLPVGFQTRRASTMLSTGGNDGPWTAKPRAVLASGPPVSSPPSSSSSSPLLLDSPSPDASNTATNRSTRPWFQRKRKPKLQQMLLSFSTTSVG